MENLFWGVVFIATGLLSIWLGRRQHSRYNRMRVATDTPGADGLVRIRARIRSQNSVISPLTATRCCYFRVEVEQDKEPLSFSSDDSNSNTTNWHRTWREESNGYFVLDAPGGDAAVRPAGMDLDLPPKLERVVYSKSKEAGDQALLDYLKRSSPDPFRNALWEKSMEFFLTPERAADPDVQARLKQTRERLDKRLQRDVKHHNYRFREYAIQSGEEYEIVARSRTDAAHGRVLVKDESSGFFLISAGGRREIDRRQLRIVWSFVGWGVGFCIFGIVVLVMR